MCVLKTDIGCVWIGLTHMHNVSWSVSSRYTRWHCFLYLGAGAEIVALRETIEILRKTIANKGEQMRNVRVEDG